ncbi:MAG: ATP-dependent helicase [Verrucomicrobia bacterium]|nr:ATP-dependent helicase [Verrucomicrobiota bacterium]
MTTGSGIRDNHNRGAIGDFLKEKLRPEADLSFVSAYFTIYAYAALRDELDSIKHLRFLFGEPQFLSSMDPEEGETKTFRIENDALALTNRLAQKRVARECADWFSSKVDIRSIVEPGFLHGKMYHINNNGVSEAILGSSNFTVSGLGLGASRNNVELNLVVNDNRDREDLKQWFDELWEDESLVKDVKEDVLRRLAQLYENHAPEFIYFKTLYHLFEHYLSEAEKGKLLEEKTGFFESDVWDMLYDFQKDGVKGAINKILTHGGCIIADSVGLGKTFEALAVIKYFELLNSRVLVLCPKKLRDNWTVYRENDDRNPLKKDRFAYTVLSHTDLTRDSGKSGDVDLATHSWGNYDLVVIDESHNFRNSKKGKDDEEGNFRYSRYGWLMEKILRAGVPTKVLLLSATPVNTNLKDLRNQILLITQDEDRAFAESLKIGSIGNTMRLAQANFTKWADPKKNKERKVAQLLEALDSGFFALLDELTIARSRKHIENYYNIEGVGRFPDRLKPLTRAPDIDTKGYFPTYDQLNDEISKFRLSVYNPSLYVDPKFLPEYPEVADDASVLEDQRQREHYLIGMMRVNFLKRLESSIESFEITIERTIQKIEDLQDKIRHFKENQDEYQEPGLFDDLEDEELAELKERLEVGKKLKFPLKHLDIKGWQKDLEADRKQLVRLHEAAAAVDEDRDQKLQELKILIGEKVANPINVGNRKVLVFTAFSDTASYLYRALSSWVRDELGLHIALVTGAGDNKTTFKPKGFKAQTDFNAILTNFSPRSKQREKMKSMPQEGEIDILIASDCISEGQNLQDCDYLINYDIHWNPVRIIQRFGRIDRLGSTNEQIQLVNFWPTQDLNKYINLKDRVEARMALVDIAATGEDDLLNTDQIKELVEDELTYREKQLLRLKDEVLDLEEMDDNVSLSEFTLDDFRIELMNYLKANEKELKDAPTGLYAVTPTPVAGSGDLFDQTFNQIVKPGVIFCLRHESAPAREKQRSVNPLSPHFLVYVRDDGEVRYNFIHAKQILTIYQALCRGKTAAINKLCELFDAETDNGNDMSKYDGLLKKAVGAVTKTFQKRTAAGLQSGRDFVIPDKKEQASGIDDFELITWLVVSAGETDA